jgi:NAD+ kinase
MIIKKVGLLYHPKVPAARTKAQELSNFLISRSVETWSVSAWETQKAIDLLNGTDLILTTGGDGTIVRAAQVTNHSGTPIVGVNMGTLGFLTEIKIAEAEHQLSQLLEGQGWLDERAMLEAELQAPEQDAKAQSIYYALNDVVMARGAIARLIKVNTSIDGQTLTNYRADGVIIATATGSTGYSLAAGGPVLYPQSRDLLVVPILSHLGMNYPLVVPEESVIKLQLVTNIPATLSIDGYENIPLSNGCAVVLKLSSRRVRFLRLHPQTYFFNQLEEKLKGKI